MRSAIFNILFWGLLVAMVLAAYALTFLPWRQPVVALMRTTCSGVRGLMRGVLGIRIEIRGRIPRDEAVIVASKHQSWADGFVMMSVLGDINFVIGNGIETFPLIGRIVARSGATMVASPGLRGAEGALHDAMKTAADDPRVLLIYPEGGLAPVGEAKRYRKGVQLMYETLNRPVVPVATNLGLRWPQNKWTKRPGPAVVEFLAPIPPGLPRDDFLPRLQLTIETRTRDLETEGMAAKETST
ncbi:1-acyl-sn-glycerol-3-phosphate acyltransferase [Maricaulis sp.]|uniref:lysophospholipid acyltransferase family protein n=1 Tax=Maricaulis sp. TaxID=1486257 RepID=UPI00260BD285|nr:1-acyl-sn-glycerol-3-phosphate acyltransferase [Maricaulis sp.]